MIGGKGIYDQFRSTGKRHPYLPLGQVVQRVFENRSSSRRHRRPEPLSGCRRTRCLQSPKERKPQHPLARAAFSVFAECFCLIPRFAGLISARTPDACPERSSTPKNSDDVSEDDVRVSTRQNSTARQRTPVRGAPAGEDKTVRQAVTSNSASNSPASRVTSVPFSVLQLLWKWWPYKVQCTWRSPSGSERPPVRTTTPAPSSTPFVHGFSRRLLQWHRGALQGAATRTHRS